VADAMIEAQDWAQSVAVDQAYRRVPETLGRILDVHPSVDSLERMNLKMAETVRPSRESCPAPERPCPSERRFEGVSELWICYPV
jgi:hypothetical protein